MVGLSVVARLPWFPGVLASALLLVGCGLDSASATAGGESDTDGPGTAPSTAPDQPESSGNDVDTDDPGVETEGSGGTSGEPPGETMELDDCAVDCGVNGMCELDEDGHPQCVCDSGFASTGLQCVACTTVQGSVDADVPIADAVFEFRIADAEPPAMIQDSGRIVLRNTASGDEVLLGTTYEGGATKTIVPGMYEIYYSKFEAGAGVPVNRNALLETRFIDDAEPIVVNVPVATITGSITIAGETPSASPYDFGRVFLVDRTTGDEALLAATREGSFVVNVIPGTYAIHYRLGQADVQAPLNDDTRIGEVTVAPAGEVLQDLQIDVPAIDVSGAITINNQPPPGIVQDYGRIVFVDRSTNDRIDVGTTRDGSYAARLVQGDYDVFYERVAGGIGVPINEHALLQKLSLDATGVFDIDVPAVSLTGAFTVDGAMPPVDASDDGVVMLRNATGDVAHLGNTHDGAFEAFVVPGMYDVYYAQETAGAMMPGNTNAFVRQLNVTQAGSRTLDIPVAHVSGALAVSGGVPPDSVYDDGRVYLRNRTSGDAVLLGNTRLAQYSATVVPGTYDVVYEAELSDAIVPVNKAAVIVPDVVVDAGERTLDIDVPVAQVSGQIQIANAVPPTGGEELGNLYLEDVQSEDLIWIGSTLAPNFATPLASGRYLLRYRGQAGGDALPANANAGISCFDVVAE